MSDLLALLNQQITYDAIWYERIRKSLMDFQDDWFLEVYTSESMSKEHAWNLLSWIETASNDLVRNPERRTLELAIFARALLSRSKLDDRDIWVIMILVRRGAEISGLNYLDAVSTGCAEAGELGEAVFRSLVHTSKKTPSSMYEERGAGQDFEFFRLPVEFDAEELLRRIGDGKSPPPGE